MLNALRFSLLAAVAGSVAWIFYELIFASFSTREPQDDVMSLVMFVVVAVAIASGTSLARDHIENRRMRKITEENARVRTQQLASVEREHQPPPAPVDPVR